MSRKNEMQRLIKQYKFETGAREVDMHEVARWMTAQGWPLPPPIDPIDRLAKELSKAAREEVRYSDSGRPYRANHAFPSPQGGKQLMLWVDIDEATRPQMHRSLNLRREQMVGDAVQLTLGADLLRRRKADRFREVGFGGAFRIDRVRVAFAV
jgi:hypothetical protein